MKILLAPLQRLANLIETQNKAIDEIHSVLTVDLKKAAEENSENLKESNSILSAINTSLKTAAQKSIESSALNSAILGDIRDLLSEKNAKAKKDTGTGPDFPKAMDVAAGGMMIIVMAASLVAAAGILSVLTEVSPIKFVTALAIAGLFTILAPVFIKIESALDRGAGRLVVDKLTGTNDRSFKGMMSMVGSIGSAMVAMSISVVLAGFILSAMPTGLSAGQFVTALAVAFIFIPLSYAIGGMIKQLSRSKLGLDKKSIGKLAVLPLIITGMALGLVAAAWIFKAMPDDFSSLPPMGWVVGMSLLLYAMSYAIGRLSAVTKKYKIKDIAVAALLALPLLAGSIVAAAWIMTGLPEGAAYNAPPLKWILSVGLGLTLLAIPLAILAVVSKKVGIKGIALGALAMVALAGTILAAAWIFSVLPTDFIAPPTEWAIGAAIALTLFAIPMAVVGLIATSGIGAVGLLLGAAGLILIAGTMWVVAWIFSKLPDLGAASKNVTDALMYPVNAMIGALKRFKDEIGIENMVPLAGGILAIAGAWLTLTAAMAGQGIGGAIGAVGNLIGEGINKLTEWFGGEKAMGPKDLLELLIDKAEGLKKIASPLGKIGTGFKGIGTHAGSVQLALGALIPFTQEDEREELEKSANAVAKIASGYASIANSSTLMNVDAINASSRMFEAIAKVAEADGEDAMSVLAKQLMAAVRELSETVENLQEANGENTNSMTDAISSTIGGFIDKIKGTAESGSDSGLIDVQPIVSAIQELEDRLERPLRVEEA